MPTTIPQSDLKIAYEVGVPSDKTQIGTSILQFTITTTNGVKYTFDKREYSLRQPGAVFTTYGHTTAWFLTRIDSQVGDHFITLDYENTYDVIHKYNNEAHELTAAGDEVSFQRHSKTNLKQITSNDTKIVFNRALREDAKVPSEIDGNTPQQEYKLTSIEVKKNDTFLAKKFEFNTSIYSERLFLDSLQEFGSTGNSMPGYKFQYITPAGLPDRLSRAIDHWGYYNGQIDNDNSNKFINSGSYFDEAIQTMTYHSGANREVSPEKARYGVLEKIVYPTGGEVFYDYESNDYSIVMNKPIYGSQNLTVYSEIVPTKTLNSITEIQNETFADSGATPLTVSVVLFYECLGTYVDYDRLFIGDHDGTQVNGWWVNHDYAAIDSAGSADYTCTEFYEDYGEPGPGGNDTGGYIKIYKDFVINVSDYTGTIYFDLDDDGAVSETDDTAYLTYRADGYRTIVDSPTSQIAKLGPGLRVSKSYIESSSSAPAIVKEYTYGTSDPGTGFYESSGVMYQEPVYYKRGFNEYDHKVGIDSLVSGITIAPYNTFGMGDKGMAGYSYVKESVEGQGFTEYEFYSNMNFRTHLSTKLSEFVTDTSYYSLNFTYNPNVLTSMYMGKPITITTLDDQERVLSKKEFTENETDTSSFQTEKVYYALAFDTKLSGSPAYPALQPYHISIPFLANTGSKNKIYEGGMISMETSLETEYTSSTHKNPTKVTETNSLTSEKRVTSYAYAHDFYYVGAGNMVEKNMRSQLYFTDVTNATGLEAISKSQTIWDDSLNGAASGVWLPKEQWVWKKTGTGSTWIKASEVLEYDSYGNPLEIQSGTGSTASVTKAFYGSTAQPFQNATTTGNAVNGVLGVYLTGVQIVNGIEDVITGGVRPVSGDDLFSTASYDGIGRVISKTDENEQRTSYGYDSFHRLITQTNANGMIIGATGYGYSAQRNAGSFASDDPNNVQQITYLDPFYATDFTTNEGWTGTLSEATFDYDFNGEKTVRLGNTSGTTNFRRNSTVTDFVVRTDYYASSVLTGHPHVFMFNNGSHSNNTSRRFSIQYLTATDEFRIVTRQYGDTADSLRTAFPMDAAPNTWYTFEIEKKGDTITGWVYPRGSTRSEANSLSYSGYNTSWKPTMYFQTAKNYVYLSNFSMAKATQSSVSYLDGLGREIQTQVRGGNTVIATETLYNERGLPEIAARPIERTVTQLPGFFSTGLLEDGVAFSGGNATNAIAPVASHYAQYHTGTGDNNELYAYSYTQYENNPLARVEKSTLPGEGHQTVASQAITTSYGLNAAESFTINGKTWGLNTLSKTVSKDPEGNETITYTNGWGQTIVSGVNMNPTVDDVLDKSTSDLVTEFGYDAAGNLEYVKDPKGLETTYSYNTLGQLESKSLPDQTGDTNYKYDDKGRLRFVEHADHKLNGSSFSVTVAGADPNVDETISPTQSGRLSFTVDVGTYYGYQVEVLDYSNGSEKLISDEAPADEGWETTASKSMVVGPGSYKLSGYPNSSQGDGWATPSGAYTFNPFKYSYTKYDELDRPIEMGEYYGSTTFANADANSATFPTSSRQKLVEYKYDQGISYPTANNTKGKLSEVWSYDPNDLNASPSKTLYSYNTLGLVEWIEQDLNGLTARRIEYEYDELGRMTRTFFDSPTSGEDFYFWYKYDELGRLQYVLSNENSSESTAIQEAEYSYYADGQIEQLTIGPDGAPVQTVDYTYTIQGWLDAINNGNVNATSGKNYDRFAMDLGYAANGNINSQVWKQSELSTSSVNYAYSYDEANRLEQACYGGTCSTGGNYDVTYAYDKNGNIESINRYANTSGADRIFDHAYISNTNKLSVVVEDGTPKGFGHDAKGNVISNGVQGIDHVSYDWRNLATWTVANGSALLYNYDADGNRIKKEVVDGTTIYYIRGADGQTIAAYQGNELVYWVLPGGLGLINY